MCREPCAEKIHCFINKCIVTMQVLMVMKQHNGWKDFGKNRVKAWSIYFILCPACVVTIWQMVETNYREQSSGMSLLDGLTWRCYTVSHPDWLSDRVDNLVSSVSVTSHPPHVATCFVAERKDKERREKQRREEDSPSSQNTNICRVYFTDRKASKTCRVTTPVLTKDTILINPPEDDWVI